MFPDNPMDDGETSTSPLARFFGGHKRLKDLREQLGGNSAARIGDSQSAFVSTPAHLFANPLEADRASRVVRRGFSRCL
jgi:hypothetical protein